MALEQGTPVRTRTTVDGRRQKAMAVLGDSLGEYLRAIAPTPVLTRAQTYELAKVMEAQERIFRRAMFAIPATARAVVERWRRREGRVAPVLRGRHREASGRDGSPHIEAALGEIEKLALECVRTARSGNPHARRRSADLNAEIAARLEAAELELDVLLSIFRDFQGMRTAAAPGRCGPASRADRVRLVRAQRAMDRLEEAKRTLVFHNLKLVVKIAKRYRNLGVPFADLIQEGNLGLIRAAEKFDYHLGFSFSTYAVCWIQQALSRAVQKHSRTVPIPSQIGHLQSRYRRASLELRQRLRRPPQRAELAEALSVAPDIVDRVAASLKPVASIQATFPGTDAFSLESVLATKDADDPVDCIDRLEMRRVLRDAVARLAQREHTILEYRFGLNGEGPLSLEKVGRRLGISRERVRQLEVRALARLRQDESVARLATCIDLMTCGKEWERVGSARSGRSFALARASHDKRTREYPDQASASQGGRRHAGAPPTRFWSAFSEQRGLA